MPVGGLLGVGQQEQKSAPGGMGALKGRLVIELDVTSLTPQIVGMLFLAARHVIDTGQGQIYYQEPTGESR